MVVASQRGDLRLCSIGASCHSHSTLNLMVPTDTEYIHTYVCMRGAATLLVPQLSPSISIVPPAAVAVAYSSTAAVAAATAAVATATAAVATPPISRRTLLLCALPLFGAVLPTRAAVDPDPSAQPPLSVTVPEGLAELAATLESAAPLIADGRLDEVRQLIQRPIVGEFLGYRPPVAGVSPEGAPTVTAPSEALIRAYPLVSRGAASLALSGLSRRLSELDALCSRQVAPSAASDAAETLDAARYLLTEAISRYYGPARADGIIECLPCAGDLSTKNMR